MSWPDVKLTPQTNNVTLDIRNSLGTIIGQNYDNDYLEAKITPPPGESSRQKQWYTFF